MKQRGAFEIRSTLAAAFGQLLGDPHFAGTAAGNDWCPGALVDKFFERLAKKGGPVLR